MKLSEAILLNGASKPQGFGPDAMYSADAPCALGGALQSVNRQITNNDSIGEPYREIFNIWPWTCFGATYPCPGCNVCYVEAEPLELIWHLNDTHEWTRAQIAEWVATVEPAENVEEPCVSERGMVSV